MKFLGERHKLLLDFLCNACIFASVCIYLITLSCKNGTSLKKTFSFTHNWRALSEIEDSLNIFPNPYLYKTSQVTFSQVTVFASHPRYRNLRGLSVQTWLIILMYCKYMSQFNRRPKRPGIIQKVILPYRCYDGHNDEYRSEKEQVDFHGPRVESFVMK